MGQYLSLLADRAKEHLVRIGRKMAEEGLVTGTWGNLSCYVSKDDVIVITPSGLDYRQITVGDIPVVNMAGEVLEGSKTPSTELPLHLAVYATRQDVKAVIHTHSQYASAIAAVRKSIPPILEDATAMIGGAVPVVGYAPPGSKELAWLVAEALGKVDAVLIANHGVVGVGETLQEALAVCEMVERTAQVYILASTVAEPVALPEEEVQRLRATYLQNYREKGKYR